MQNSRTITHLLEATSSGDDAASNRLYELTYEQLRGLARRIRSGNRGQTVNTTALVHEAYFKLLPGGAATATDRVHFFRIAARAMRQVLIDAARRRATRDHGALLIDNAATDSGRVSAEVLDLERALCDLEAINPRHAAIVECRFFAGLSVEETAAALGVSEPTVKRDWRVARAWLAEKLDPPAARGEA